MKGIPASPGIGIGRLFRIEEPNIHIDDRIIEQVEEELARFRRAIDTSIQQVSAIEETVRQNGHEEEAAVFEAHKLMLEDPEWIQRIEALIVEQKRNCPFAIETVTEELASILSALDDEYLSARAADLRDIAGRTIKNALGIVPFDPAGIKEPVVLSARDLTPSDTALLSKETVLGFITEQGNKTSHTAIIARTLGIPAIVGTSEIMEIPSEEMIALDGETGEIWVQPTDEVLRILKEKKARLEADALSLEAVRGKESITEDGYTVELAGNIGKPENVQFVVMNDGEGIGLFRSEFLYMDREQAPTEDEQYRAYRSVVETMGQRPVVIRTLDAGGDKAIPYINIGEEMNPFLGYRAIRICLDDHELFRTQLRAILRASAHGKVKIMFPMIATLQEWRRAKDAVLEAMKELEAERIPFDAHLELGIMVEIPSAALLADIFAKEVDFFSIGTNDLTQYVLAADRMNGKLETLYSTFNPAVLRMIQQVIQAGKQQGKWVGMCGEAAGDLKMIPLLIAMGLEEFSMAPATILKARALIRSLNRGALEPLLEDVMAMDDAQAIELKMEQYLKTILG